MRDGGDGQSVEPRVPTDSRYDVFIAHASVDKEAIARPLHDALVAAGLAVWFDERAMDAVAALGRSIDDGIARSRYGIAIVSPASLRSNFFRREVEAMRVREMGSDQDLIIAILHGDPDPNVLKDRLPALIGKRWIHSNGDLAAIVDAVLRVFGPPVIAKAAQPARPFASAPAPVSSSGASTAPTAIPTVAIVGGGFSAVVTAIRLVRHATEPFKLVVVNEAGEGRYGGLAYGEATASWEHILNIQAGRLSIFREHPADFLQWTRRAVRDAWLPKWKQMEFRESSPVPRRIYGQYLTSRFQELLASNTLVEKREIAGRVVDVAERNGTATVFYRPAGTDLESVVSFEATQVILATGHGPPQLPAFVSPVRGHARFFSDAYDRRMVEVARGLGPEQRVLVIGSGLSAFDAVVTLVRAGFAGTIAMCSRGGHTHRTYPDDHTHDILPLSRPAPPPDSLSAPEMFDVLKSEIDRGAAFFARYYPDTPGRIMRERVLKALEPWIAELFQRSAPEAARGFLAQSKSWLTTTRTSVVPEVATVIEDAKRRKQVELIKGTILSMEPARPDTITVSIDNEGSRIDDSFSLVVCCAGLQADYDQLGHGLWRNLIKDRETAVPHRKTGLGIEVGPHGELVSPAGVQSAALLAVGPMRQGDEIERRGRMGAFVFSIGTLRNQALSAALTVLKRIESPAYARLTEAERASAETAVEAALGSGELAKSFRDFVEAAKILHFTQPQRTSDLAALKARHSLRASLEEICTSEALSGLPLDGGLIRHLVYHRAVIDAARDLSDIGRLPDQYDQVRRFDHVIQSRCFDAKHRCRDCLRESTEILRAASGSLLILDHDNDLLPFVSFRRRDKFTKTRYGEAIAGKLIKAFRERTNFPPDPQLRMRFRDGRIAGLMIDDYNRLHPDLKKSTYDRAVRQYPSVLVAVLARGDEPLGVLYLEAPKDLRFSVDDLDLLIELTATIRTTVSEARNVWDGTPDDSNDLYKANFREQILSSHKFRNSYLVEANFCRAILSGSDLSRADCRRADFSGANLEGATLVGTCFERANLSGACLHGTTLAATSFAEANLSGASLVACRFDGTSFAGADLRGATLSLISLLGGVDFSNADLRGATLPDLNKFSDSTWNHLRVDGARVDEQTFQQLPDGVRKVVKLDRTS